MNRVLLVVLLSTFICVKFAYGTDPEVEAVEADDDIEESYEIIQGNCTTALAVEMVFHDHVHLSYIPFFKRNGTSEWYGDEKIYCLMVLNEKDESQGSTAYVKAGGVGHNFVTVEMHSLSGHGLEFDIQVYGKI